MEQMTVRTLGGDRYEIDIRGHRLVVDQPVDGGGTDAGPTPTELFVASVASCSAHYAGRFLARHGVDPDGLGVTCSFTFATDRPARVGSIDLTLDVPAGLPDDALDRLRAVVEHCTVKNSLVQAPDVRLQLARADVPVG
jgi:putative redox protein